MVPTSSQTSGAQVCVVGVASLLSEREVPGAPHPLWHLESILLGH